MAKDAAYRFHSYVYFSFSSRWVMHKYRVSFSDCQEIRLVNIHTSQSLTQLRTFELYDFSLLTFNKLVSICPHVFLYHSPVSLIFCSTLLLQKQLMLQTILLMLLAISSCDYTITSLYSYTRYNLTISPHVVVLDS